MESNSAGPPKISEQARLKSRAEDRRSAWRPISEAPSRTSRTRMGLNVTGILIALATAVWLVPATYKHHLDRIPPPGKRAWRMYDLVGITETAAIARFGKPSAQIEYQLNKGSVAGPLLGQKNYYRFDAPDFDKRMAEAKVTWAYPAYSAVRELTWKLADSYLTIWFQEPRGEITFSEDRADMTLPSTGPGEWVALDNYRVGFDLVAPARK